MVHVDICLCESLRVCRCESVWLKPVSADVTKFHSTNRNLAFVWTFLMFFVVVVVEEEKAEVEGEEKEGGEGEEGRMRR